MTDPKDPKKKKIPSSIKATSTTVVGKRGARTTTTTVAKKFKGTLGKNLGKDFKPTKAQTAKANAEKALKKRTPATSSSVTTERKSKGVADVANASTRKLSTKITTKPKVKKFTKRELVSITKKTSDPKTRETLKNKIRKEFPTQRATPEVRKKIQKKNKRKQTIRKVKNLFGGSPFSSGEKKSSGGGCYSN